MGGVGPSTAAAAAAATATTPAVAATYGLLPVPATAAAAAKRLSTNIPAWERYVAARAASLDNDKVFSGWTGGARREGDGRDADGGSDGHDGGETEGGDGGKGADAGATDQEEADPVGGAGSGSDASSGTSYLGLDDTPARFVARAGTQTRRRLAQLGLSPAIQAALLRSVDHTVDEWTECGCGCGEVQWLQLRTAVWSPLALPTGVEVLLRFHFRAGVSTVDWALDLHVRPLPVAPTKDAGGPAGGSAAGGGGGGSTAAANAVAPPTHDMVGGVGAATGGPSGNTGASGGDAGPAGDAGAAGAASAGGAAAGGGPPGRTPDDDASRTSGCVCGATGVPVVGRKRSVSTAAGGIAAGGASVAAGGSAAGSAGPPPLAGAAARGEAPHPIAPAAVGASSLKKAARGAAPCGMWRYVADAWADHPPPVHDDFGEGLSERMEEHCTRGVTSSLVSLLQRLLWGGAPSPMSDYALLDLVVVVAAGFGALYEWGYEWEASPKDVDAMRADGVWQQVLEEEGLASEAAALASAEAAVAAAANGSTAPLRDGGSSRGGNGGDPRSGPPGATPLGQHPSLAEGASCGVALAVASRAVVAAATSSARAVSRTWLDFALRRVSREVSAVDAYARPYDTVRVRTKWGKREKNEMGDYQADEAEAAWWEAIPAADEWGRALQQSLPGQAVDSARVLLQSIGASMDEFDRRMARVGLSPHRPTCRWPRL